MLNNSISFGVQNYQNEQNLQENVQSARFFFVVWLVVFLGKK